MASSGGVEAQGGTGFIRLETIISDSPTVDLRSNETEVNGLPWSLVLKRSPDSSNLMMYLFHRNSFSPWWSIDVSMKFTLVNFNQNGSNITKEMETTFNGTTHAVGHIIVPWEKLMKEEEGFIKNGTIVTEVSFRIFNLSGFDILPSFDFTKKGFNFDVELKIGGKKIYVNKGTLCTHSSYFYRMFYTDNSGEKKQKETELKEVDHKEFIVMLNLIYPTCNEITDDNALIVLKLGSGFEFPKLVKEVEKFLINSEKFTIFTKFNLSDQYKLFDLMEYCFDTLNTPEDVEEIMMSEECSPLLSGECIKALMVKKASIVRIN